MTRIEVLSLWSSWLLGVLAGVLLPFICAVAVIVAVSWILRIDLPKNWIVWVLSTVGLVMIFSVVFNHLV